MADSFPIEHLNDEDATLHAMKRKDFEKERSSGSEESRDSDRRRRRSRKRSRRSRSYSRSCSRSVSRSRSRSRKKNRRRHEFDERDEGGSEGDYRYYHRDTSPLEHRSERGRSRWNDGAPNNVLLIRNLSLQLTEDEVRAEFEKHGVAMREVRLMRSRDTGESLRYCFVEFYSVSEAQDWMQFNQGEMRVEGGRTWYMYYSNTRRGSLTPGVSSSSSLLEQDWLCTKCSCANFQRRSFCRRCSHAREDTTRRSAFMTSVMSDGSDQVGTNPCNTLLLRGLDGLTTEETITSVILHHTRIQALNCHVARDRDTGASNGYALVELSSAMEAGVVLKHFSSSSSSSSSTLPPLEVDGKVLVANYARNNFNTALSSLQASTITPHQPSHTIPHLTMPTSSKDFSENTAAAVAQAAMMKRRPAYHHNPPPTTMPTRATTKNAYPKYPMPDTSKFTFDQSSGYYLDPSTNFYYDAKTQYFYNALKKHFMYWDSEQSTYIPVASDNTQASSSSSSSTTTNTAATTTAAIITAAATTTTVVDNAATATASTSAFNEKAKKIAKDMERWAKRMNQQKEAVKPVYQAPPATTTITTAAVVASVHHPPQDAAVTTQSSGKNKLEKLDQIYSTWDESTDDPGINKQFSIPADTSSSSSPPPPAAASSSPSSASSSGGGGMVDWARLTCVLCRRAFLNHDTLTKHLQLSQLHKTNLAEYLKTHADTETQAYRDRASERRRKFGDDEAPPPSSKRGRRRDDDAARVAEAAVEASVPVVAAEDAVASKLMRKMGWREGEGLGRNHQGIVDPIQATMRQSLAGLGSRVLETKVDGMNHYNDRLKDTFRAYFNDIN